MIALALLLPPLFALSAFFSGAETVLFSLTGAQRARIRAADGRADAAIDACLADKAVLFSTILVGNTVVNFAISTIGYHLFSAWLPFGGAVSRAEVAKGLQQVASRPGTGSLQARMPEGRLVIRRKGGVR